MGTETPAEGIYLFCLGHPLPEAALNVAGLDERGGLFQCRFRNVAAVFCRVELEPWICPAAEENLRDLAWVGPRACRHEAVIEHVMRFSPVLPARFGTFFSAPHRLERMVRRNYGPALCFLSYMADKEEWAVKGLVDRGRAMGHLLAADPRASALPSSPGVRYLIEQRLRGEAGEQVTAWVRRLADALLPELQELSVAFRPLRILPSGVLEREQTVSFNWAFLVEKDTVEAFQARIEQSNSESAQRGLLLELSGVWPPHSFCPALDPAV